MALLLTALLLAAGPDPVTVRASAAALPCATAAGQAFERSTGRRVVVEAGAAGGDVLVAAAVEMTRAVESGAAVDGSDVSLARIPWVVSLPGGNPQGIRTLQDLDRNGVEIAVPAGPAAYEARRALAGLRAARVREESDAARLRQAAVALVPLSLAGAAEVLKVDVPPLVIEAALAKDAAHPEAGRELLRFLTSEEGQKAFAACG